MTFPLVWPRPRGLVASAAASTSVAASWREPKSFFARNDPKTLRTMDAVTWSVDHYEDLPALVVPCLRWTTHGPIVSGVRLPFPPLWAAKRALGLPPWASPIAVIPVAWPLGRYGPTTRKPVGDGVHFDRYGNRPYAGRRASIESTD